ncbi:MAG: hypothetical protein [Circular genetic element sp.]|nr:MAG: hypothetical protein [Circular genetic element sp.]
MVSNAIAGTIFMTREHWRKVLVKKGLTPFGVGAAVVGTRMGVEAAGLSISYLLDGKEGVKNWQVASSKMYDWGPVEKTPFIGSLVSLLPNPIGVGEVMADTTMIMAHEMRNYPQLAWSLFGDMARKSIPGRLSKRDWGNQPRGH